MPIIAKKEEPDWDEPGTKSGDRWDDSSESETGPARRRPEASAPSKAAAPPTPPARRTVSQAGGGRGARRDYSAGRGRSDHTRSRTHSALQGRTPGGRPRSDYNRWEEVAGHERKILGNLEAHGMYDRHQHARARTPILVCEERYTGCCFKWQVGACVSSQREDPGHPVYTADDQPCPRGHSHACCFCGQWTDPPAWRLAM